MVRLQTGDQNHSGSNPVLAIILCPWARCDTLIASVHAAAANGDLVINWGQGSNCNLPGAPQLSDLVGLYDAYKLT